VKTTKPAATVAGRGGDTDWRPGEQPGAGGLPLAPPGGSCPLPYYTLYYFAPESPLPQVNALLRGGPGAL
jgi:hypothetical protein